MSVTDKVAPIKERWVKQNSLKIVRNYLKSLKNQNCTLTKMLNAARYKVRKMIFDEKRSFFEKKKNK